MAKFAFVVMLIVAAVAVVASAPAEEFEPLEMSQAERFTGEHFEDQEDHLRFRRVTCDLLSATGMVADTACAANCLSMGKAGGTCNGGVCQCRKTSFKDLWDKRFG